MSQSLIVDYAPAVANKLQLSGENWTE